MVGGLSGLAVGGAVYAAACRHLGVRRGLAAAAAAFALYMLDWSFTGLLATVCAVLAIVAYVLVRFRLSGVSALVTAFGTYVVLAVGLGGMLYVSLSEMG